MLVGRRARVPGFLARRKEGRVRGAAERRRATSSLVDLQTEEITNLTKDDVRRFGADVRARRQVHRLHRARQRQREAVPRRPRHRTEDAADVRHPRRRRGAVPGRPNTIVFPSTATDPAQPIDPDVARNGNIYNVWTLDLKNGELRQYTDALGGNRLAGRAERRQANRKIAFVTYYKGEYELHTLDGRDPLATAASSDFGAPGPIIDFQAPLSHTLVARQQAKKGKFEKMFLDGRPPVNLGVTSSGDIFGGTAVTFSDVLGDQQFNIFAASISQYRTLSLLVPQPRRTASSTRCRATRRRSSSTASSKASSTTRRSRGSSIAIWRLATRTIRGGSAFGIYPFNRYRRVELSGGFQQYSENFNDPSLQAYSEQYQVDNYGQPAASDTGTLIPFGVTFVAGDDRLP